MKPSEIIITNAVKLRSIDWVDWGGNRHSKEAWDLMNPINLKETDYLMLGLLKYLDEVYEAEEAKRLKLIEDLDKIKL